MYVKRPLLDQHEYVEIILSTFVYLCLSLLSVYMDYKEKNDRQK